MLRHVVLFALREGASTADAEELVRELEGLRATVPGVRALACGRDVSGRGSFQVGLTVDFDDRAGLAAYLAHPEHARVVAEVLPRLARPHREVVDFPLETPPARPPAPEETSPGWQG